MKKQLIVAIILLIIILSAVFAYKNKQDAVVEPVIISSETSVQDSDKADLDPSVKSFVTKTSDSNVNIYTSPSLGLKFKYAINDPSNQTGENTVIEKGNSITIQKGGGEIAVFSKNSNTSFEEAIKKEFDLPNCKLEIKKVSEPLDMHARVILRDVKTGDTIYLEDNGDFEFSTQDKKCREELQKNTEFYDYFAASSQNPTKYIGVNVSTQAVEAVLRIEKDTVVWWMSTLEFLK